jgi:cell wall-associated NlpC family hydrolase
MTEHATAPDIRYPRAMRRVLLCLPLAAALLLAGCSTTPPSAPSTPSRSAVYSRLSHEQASDIAIHALGLVGTPYRYGGNTPDSGFDCSGLIGYVYKSRAGVAPPRTVAQLGEFGQAVDSSELRTGDLVIFGAGRSPSHAGIYVGEGRFVHAPSTGGTVRLDQLASNYWAKQRASFRRP